MSHIHTLSNTTGSRREPLTSSDWVCIIYLKVAGSKFLQDAVRDSGGDGSAVIEVLKKHGSSIFDWDAIVQKLHRPAAAKEMLKMTLKTSEQMLNTLLTAPVEFLQTQMFSEAGKALRMAMGELKDYWPNGKFHDDLDKIARDPKKDWYFLDADEKENRAGVDQLLSCINSGAKELDMTIWHKYDEHHPSKPVWDPHTVNPHLTLRVGKRSEGLVRVHCNYKALFEGGKSAVGDSGLIEKDVLIRSTAAIRKLPEDLTLLAMDNAMLVMKVYPMLSWRRAKSAGGGTVVLDSTSRDEFEQLLMEAAQSNEKKTIVMSLIPRPS